MRCIETQKEESGKQRHPDKLQHEMYWNDTTHKFLYTPQSINYNMRCIETVVTLFVIVG